MNRSLRLFAVTVSAVMGLAWSAGAVDYIPVVNFDGMTVDQPPVGWTVSGSAVVSGSGYSGNGLSIPSLSSVLNNSGNPRSGLVWTDFWTKPVKCNVDPSYDSTATAQVFVNSQNKWSTWSMVGGVATVSTYDHSLLASPNDVIPDPLDGQWHHVSVLHNYGNRTWSLYVDDLPLAFGLGFITTDNPVNGDKWFKVVTLAESSAMLDDFLVKDSIPTSLATSTGSGTAPGTENGVTPAAALTYFGAVGDPRPLPPSAVETAGDRVSITFTPNPALKYKLIGGPTPDGAMSDHSLPVDGAVLSSIADDQPFSGNVRFYKIATVSPVDGSVSLASSETYAVFKQDRPAAVSGRWLFSGIPVTMIGGDPTYKDTVKDQAGQQLLLGLSADDKLVKGNASFYINSGQWKDVNLNDALPGLVSLPAGSGVAIRRKGPATATTTYISGLWNSKIDTVTLKPGWNSLIWPYDKQATRDSAAFPLALGNQFAVQRASSGSIAIYQCIPTTPPGSISWAKSDGSLLNPTGSEWPQPGEGFMFKLDGNSDGQWNPTRPP